MERLAMNSREYYNFLEEHRKNGTIVDAALVGDDGQRRIYHLFFLKTYKWLEIIVRD